MDCEVVGMLGNRQFLLMILDGIGLSDDIDGNAFRQAKTPNLDKLLSNYAHSRLKSSGLAVGLPEGQMGNSEVGHANIGAGRVIYQELTRINKSIQDGDFFHNEVLSQAIEKSKNNNTALHLIGLVSDGGVHSHQDHLYALLEFAKNNGVKKVFVHAFLDGRDTSPASAVGYIEKLQDKMAELGVGNIATFGGRYYGMDRDNRWDRIKMAYDAITLGAGECTENVIENIEKSYENGVFDEFIKPTVVLKNQKPVVTINDKDSVVMFNFRPDRSRQLVSALSSGHFLGFKREKSLNDVFFATMTEYDSSLVNVNVAFKPQLIVNSLGEYIASLGYSQLRIAETEKYAHVTFFFNGGNEVGYDGESRVLIPSPNVSTYDQKPEMSAPEITKKVIESIKSGEHDLIVVNFANGDMVGHTGMLDKAVEAVERLDMCVGEIIDELLKSNGEAIITADHGNCEYMIDKNTGESITSHSTFDVPIIVVSDRIKSISEGSLCDISPTILSIMGVDIPDEMTGHSIIELNMEDN